MKLLRAAGLMLGKTLVVTVAVVLGFTLGRAFGLPIWLQVMFLAPAGYLFYRLDGDTPPPWWKILGFLGLTALVSGSVPRQSGLFYPALCGALCTYFLLLFSTSSPRQNAETALIKPDP